jgi:hypothetical protein
MMFMVRTCLRVVGLKLVTDSSEIGIHGRRLDVVAHINSVETEGVRGRISGEVMGATEGEV